LDFVQIGHETYLKKSVGDGLLERKNLSIEKIEGDAVSAKEVGQEPANMPREMFIRMRFGQSEVDDAPHVVDGEISHRRKLQVDEPLPVELCLPQLLQCLQQSGEGSHDRCYSDWTAYA
jgi:hypothetical protein